MADGPVEKVLDTPVVKIVTAHPLISVGLGLVLIFLALLLDALVAALSTSKRGIFERMRSGVDRIVNGVKNVTAPQETAAPATAGRG